MASTPVRPYDRRILNVGTWTGPPNGTPYAGDSFLAGTTYVTDCNGNTAKNPGKPGYSYDPPEASQGVVVEADGTVKKYFVHSISVLSAPTRKASAVWSQKSDTESRS